MSTIPRFLAVGLVNTCVGLLVVMLGLRLGVGDYVANAAGYLVGILLSYGLHRRWSFAMTTPANLGEAGRFVLAVGAAYLANLGVLYVARSAGIIDSAAAQLAAIATYTVVFFVCTRFFVFVQAVDGGGWAGTWRRNWPEGLLVAGSILAWLCLSRIRLSHDIFWQFWIARQMLGGTRLYANIWELNPPLWFWSAMPVQWLAEQTGMAWQGLQVGLVLALGVASAWLVGRMLELPSAAERCILLLAQFWIVTITPLSDIGQREHLALIASLPYAALIARRRAGRPVSPLMAITVGVLGGYGFALKHYFVLVPLALELWLLWKLRRAWRPWRPELATLVVLALAYAVCVLRFTPEFFTIMVPMVRVAYDGYKVPALNLLTPPWVMFWAASVAFLFTYRRALRLFEVEPARTYFQAVVIVSAGFAFAYFIQQKGWYYQSVPVTATLAIALVVALLAMRRGPALPLLAGAALIAVPASTLLTPRPAHQPIASLSESLLGDARPGEFVFVATTAPRLAWPAVEQHSLLWPSRAFVLWMLPAIANGEVTGRSTPELRALAGKVLKATSEDIRCHPPERIIIQRPPLASRSGATFDIREFLLRDEDLRQFMEHHYTSTAASASVYVYKRSAKVSGATGAHCRAIR